MGSSSSQDPALPTVGDHLLRLFESKEGADVTFQFGEQAEFAAHTLVLDARSPVFRAMFAAEQQKAAAPPPPQLGMQLSLGRRDESAVRRLVVRIDDDTAPAAFASLLHFVYADALPAAGAGEEYDGLDAVRAKGELLVAANRYGMERMQALCEDAMREAVVDAATAAAALVLADRHGCAGLKAFCVVYVAKPGVLREVVRTEGYAELKASRPTVVAEILEQVAAGLAKEEEVRLSKLRKALAAATRARRRSVSGSSSPVCSDPYESDETEHE